MKHLVQTASKLDSVSRRKYLFGARGCNACLEKRFQLHQSVIAHRHHDPQAYSSNEELSASVDKRFKLPTWNASLPLGPTMPSYDSQSLEHRFVVDHTEEHKVSFDKPHITTAEVIAMNTKHYTQELNKMYESIESTLMDRIHESNKQRFRGYLLATVLLLIWIISVFGSRIRKVLSDQTAGIAKDTLENESLKIQTQELARAVVQTILNDKEVTAHAAAFLREASEAPETQQALLQLTLHVVQHPDSLRETAALFKNVFQQIMTEEVCHFA